MDARFKFQATLNAKTSGFKWLMDTHVKSSGSENINLVSQVIFLTQDNGVIICMSSLLKTSMFESTLYYGTPHSWFVPILDYPITNMERYRRFVSLNTIRFLFPIILF